MFFVACFYLTKEEQSEIFSRIKDRILARIDDINLIEDISTLIEPLFEIEKFEGDEDDFTSEENSLDNSGSLEKVGKPDNHAKKEGESDTKSKKELEDEFST